MTKNQKKLSKKRTTFYLFVVIVVVMLGVKLWIDASRGELAKALTARSKGDPKAPVQIVEFMDFQCPACAFGSQQLRKFMTDHPQLIHLEVKQFPLSMHNHSYIAARYAECASKQGKFWPFEELLVDRQSQWQGLGDAKPAFDAMGKELQLDQKRLETCVPAEKTQQDIDKDKEEGKALGVNSTPSYFVNGKMVVGWKSLEMELTPYLVGKKN